MGRTASYDHKELAMHAKMHGVAATCLTFGCSDALVRIAMRTYGVSALGAACLRRKKIAEQIDKEQLTIAQAVEKFNCDTQRIKKICREFGVEVRMEPKKAQVATMSTFEILSLLICGFRVPEIAEEFCVSKQRVQQISEHAAAVKLYGKDSFIEVKNGTPCETLADGRKVYRP